MNGNAAGGDPLFVTQGENNKYCNQEKFHWYIKAPDTVTLLFSKWNFPFSISLSLSSPTFTFFSLFYQPVLIWLDSNHLSLGVRGLCISNTTSRERLDGKQQQCLDRKVFGGTKGDANGDRLTGQLAVR